MGNAVPRLNYIALTQKESSTEIVQVEPRSQSTVYQMTLSGPYLITYDCYN